MSKSTMISRTEIRCTPEISALAEALRIAAGDATASSFHRRLVIAEARRHAASQPHIARLLSKIER